jgi:hypothetical protein
VPLGQERQVAADAELTLEDAVPAGQRVHAAEPTKRENDPAGHGEHEAMLVPPPAIFDVPAGQKSSQTVDPVDAAIEPGGHDKQDARPATPAKEPGAHGMRDVAPGQKWPGVQEVHSDAPASA